MNTETLNQETDRAAWLRARLGKISGSNAYKFCNRWSIKKVVSMTGKQGEAKGGQMDALNILFERGPLEIHELQEAAKLKSDSSIRTLEKNGLVKFDDQEVGPNKEALTYMNELLHAAKTGNTGPELKSAAIDWGNDNESKAREEFEFVYSKNVKQTGFHISQHSDLIGCSPDGLIIEENALIEIKCLYSGANVVDVLLNGIPQKYYYQCLFNSWVCNADRFYFISFDPRMQGKERLYVKKVEIADVQKDFEKVQRKALALEKLLRENRLKLGIK